MNHPRITLKLLRHGVLNNHLTWSGLIKLEVQPVWIVSSTNETMV
jgi:hypothetical protein